MKKLSLIFIVFLVGCFGSPQKPVDQAKEEVKPLAPIVEGYFEYSGPNEKWAAQRTFIMHVDAKETGTAKIGLIDQKWYGEESISLTGRMPAGTKDLGSEQVRDELKNLASDNTELTQNINECLYPVKIRLVRSNGETLEKKACRGQKGWPTMLSQIVSRYLAYVK